MGFTSTGVTDRDTGADPAVLTVPGWAGSGPAHWQTIWEREHPEYRRVEQRDWHNVYRPEWVARLEEAEGSTPQTGRVIRPPDAGVWHGEDFSI